MSEHADLGQALPRSPKSATMDYTPADHPSTTLGETSEVAAEL
jgi:hypothetical protein